MLPTILYIHDPSAILSPEPLRSMWAELSAEESRAFRLASCRAQPVHRHPPRTGAAASQTTDGA